MIIALEGHDRTGKTTLANSLLSCELNPVELVPRATHFSPQIPRDNDSLVRWLRTAQPEEIIYAHLIGYRNMEEACNEPGTIYIVDRGSLTLLAGSLASIMNKKKCDIYVASRIYADIQKEAGYIPTKCLRLLLYMPLNLNEIISVIEEREGCKLEDNYRRYMELFILALQLLSLHRDDTVKINCLQNINAVFHETINICKTYWERI